MKVYVPDVLHHMMGCAIEKQNFFHDEDWENFLVEPAKGKISLEKMELDIVPETIVAL
jgi:hypothetical protein